MEQNEFSRHVIIDVETAKRIEKLEAAIALLPIIRDMLLKQRIEATTLGDWIPEKKAEELLGQKKTSLWKLRKNGQLIASKTRPIFYSLESIKAYIKDSIS